MNGLRIWHYRLVLMVRRGWLAGWFGLILSVSMPGFMPDARAQVSNVPLSYTIAGATLQDHWENWSWNSTIQFNQPTPDGDRAISVQYLAAGAGLYLHAKAPISLTGLTDLNLQVQGGNTAQTIQVFANNSTPVFTFATEAHQSLRVSIPLQALGNPATLSDLYFQTAAPVSRSVWYVKSIVLTGRAGADLPDTDVLVTPNPIDQGQTNATLKFINFLANEPLQLTLTDTYGRMLRQQNLSMAGVEGSISVAGLATGTYFITVVSPRARHVRKIVVK